MSWQSFGRNLLGDIVDFVPYIGAAEKLLPDAWAPWRSQPQMPQQQAEERNPLAAMLAAQEDRRRREREALLSQPGQGIYPVNADVAGALRRIRQRPPGGRIA